MIVYSDLIFKPIALRMAKTQSFGHSECKRVKEQSAMPQRHHSRVEFLCYGVESH